ncbi:unnamed protein product [Rotaria socialis]|uniref:EF-hand domain-containing protein n=2 Tax=Rotaria socialis TaxID=392032 RepID=A0A821MT22_9BILA|nr:unnamed protein product [Rotaria socialis]CAF3364148.1 unnamed protein product [Rotaria socialis]CAF3384426.1 unnamed protein product [Rotaria socialis]CAF3392732.1 unnamed protein product [Rotaria socialis]CAF3664480.1 unnamed protein product [Rotaria socialis]
MGNQQHHQLPDDLPLHDYRYLMKNTHLSPHVIQGWYRELLTICPNGQLNKSQFIKFYMGLENSTTKNAERIAENVFEAFDDDDNNRIDFKEFLIAYALTSNGEPVEKLKYTFSIFDVDHSETIELSEMIELLKRLFTITGNKMKTYSPESVVHDIFPTLDLDQNQSISKEEFIHGCLHNDYIRHIFTF